MKNGSWVAYVGPFRFPEGDASSRRVLGVARSIVRGGRRVVVACGNRVPEEPESLPDSEGEMGLSFVGVGEITEGASRFGKATHWLWGVGRRIVSWLDSLPSRPTHVVCYGSNVSLMLRLGQWCHRHRVPLIADVVEWHDGAIMVGGGTLSPLNLGDKLTLRVLNRRTSGIIGISSYLTDYYHSRGCQTVRVPATLDTREIEPRLEINADSPLVLAYAGKSGNGRKDLIDNVIDAVLTVNAGGTRVKFVLAGSPPQEVLRLPALRSRGLASLPNEICALGRLTHRECTSLIRSADFMPMVRPIATFSMAGFPTKVPESLSLGTPVICNVTSDLGQYVRDGVEGLICEDSSVLSIVSALDRALALSREARTAMRQAARARAVASFDFREYAMPLTEFLNSVT